MTAWMFQANPKLYDLLAAAKSGFDDNWSMKVHRDRVAVGDRVYFMVSGGAAGIYVVGRVVSPVYAAVEDNAFGHWRVDVEYEAFVDPPIFRSVLTDPVTEPTL